MSADALPGLLRSMRLPTIAREYDQAMMRAEAENWGYRRSAGKGSDAQAARAGIQRPVE
jgi:hypothetical protein